MELNSDHNTLRNNTDIVKNSNNLLHPTPVLPIGISFAQLSTDVSDEHAQIMPTLSPLACHFNTSSITPHDILNSPNKSEDQLGFSPTISSDELAEYPLTHNSCGHKWIQ